MTTAAADVGVLSMNVCDITQCSICLETFTDPKALPCIHTFCLRCLDKHCEGKKQKEVTCPLCRKNFTIPPGGNNNLPSNFFILQLLQVKQLSGDADNKETFKEDTSCELCSDSDSKVTSYCIECEQHICERCSVIHSKLKVSRAHQVVREDDVPSAEERKKINLSYCDQHPAEQISLYCSDCKIVACHVCSVEKHRKHDLTDVKESADKFRDQLKDDIENVSACAREKLRAMKQLEIDTSHFMEMIATTQSEIEQKCDQLVSLIQSQKCQLVEELNIFKDKKRKEAETKKDEMERQFVITESFKRYCVEMMNKGTVCDISRTAHDLHSRAEELVKAENEPDCNKLSEVEITFKQSLSATDSVKNFIGELIFEGPTRDPHKHGLIKYIGRISDVHAMCKTEYGIAGLTVLGSEVYVVRGTSQVYVYNSEDCSFIRNLTIDASSGLGGIASCPQYKCLYINRSGKKTIYRYDLINNATSKLSLSGYCYGLSVTKCNNIITTLYCSLIKRIQEYSTHGDLIREICLDSRINDPRNCVQLSTGNYVVCHGGAQEHRVCIVDQSGRIVHSYGGSGVFIIQPCNPRHLTIDIHDNVLVAESNRIQLLSPILTYLGDIVIRGCA